MPFCPKCGVEINQGNKFCMKCGSPITESIIAHQDYKAVQPENAPLTREEQINTLGDILLLEAAALQYSETIKKTKAEKFRNAPKAPEKPREDIPLYPKRKLNIGLIIGITIGSFFVSLGFMFVSGVSNPLIPSIIIAAIVLGVFLIIYFAGANSYKKACLQAEEECKANNERKSREFEENRKQYNKALSNYRVEKESWIASHNETLNDAIIKYNSTIDEINNTYDKTKIVPVQYRKPDVIGYLYDYLSTSQADIQQGLASYDSHVQQELTQSHIDEQRRANMIAQQQAELTLAQNMIAARQNELAEEANSIADRARREQNIAAAISIIQRSQTNSLLRR